MAQPAYTIEIDSARRFVEIALIGLWDSATIASFDADLRRSLRVLPAAGCPIGQQLTIFDLTAFIVQVQDVATMFGGMAADPTIASRRIAVLVTAPLLKMQARRVAPGYGLFDDRAQALAWLFAPADADHSP